MSVKPELEWLVVHGTVVAETPFGIWTMAEGAPGMHFVQGPHMADMLGPFDSKDDAEAAANGAYADQILSIGRLLGIYGR